MRTINYNMLAKTRIFQTIIEINGKDQGIYYHKYKPDCIANFTDNGVSLYATNSLSNSKKKEPFTTIDYANLNKVKVSLCRRNYGSIAAIIVNEYHVDLILELADGNSYQLETQSWENFTKMVDILKARTVNIEDLLNVYNHYTKNGNSYIESLDRQFDELAKTFDLSSYRGNNVREKS